MLDRYELMYNWETEIVTVRCIRCSAVVFSTYGATTLVALYNELNRHAVTPCWRHQP